MMVVHMISPDGIARPAIHLQLRDAYIKDVLARVDGVGDVNIFGARDYSMRIWLDPGKVAARGLTADDVVARVAREPTCRSRPARSTSRRRRRPARFQLSVQTLGPADRLEQFGDIVVRADPDGGYVRIRDIARVELGSQDYTVNAYLNKAVATAIVIYQRPGSNALTTAAAVKRAMEEAKQNFPSGLDYTVVYNPTEFIQQSINEVVQHAVRGDRPGGLRGDPVPADLARRDHSGGRHSGLAGRLLSGHGRRRHLASTHCRCLAWCWPSASSSMTRSSWWRTSSAISSRACRRRRRRIETMDEVGGALLAIALVLCAVFIPTAFISGLQGSFYRQFAITIASATVISASSR